jgi:hypothetical protein
VQRREAIQLLREIGSFPEVTPFTCVHLKSRNRTINNQSEDVELYVKANRDMLTRQVVERVALRHELRVKEEPDGFLAIYTPKRTLLEITA